MEYEYLPLSLVEFFAIAVSRVSKQPVWMQEDAGTLRSVASRIVARDLHHSVHLSVEATSRGIWFLKQKGQVIGVFVLQTNNFFATQHALRELGFPSEFFRPMVSPGVPV